MKKLTLASVTITLSLILVGCNSDTSEKSNNTQSDNTDNQEKKVKIMKILTMIKLNQVERATINITLIKMIIIKVIQKENKPKIKKKVI